MRMHVVSRITGDILGELVDLKGVGLEVTGELLGAGVGLEVVGDTLGKNVGFKVTGEVLSVSVGSGVAGELLGNLPVLEVTGDLLVARLQVKEEAKRRRAHRIIHMSFFGK